MKVEGKPYRTIWLEEETLRIIDQRQLPHRFVVEDLYTVDAVVEAIKDMHVRGAGLIGATAGYGMYLATREARKGHFCEDLYAAREQLKKARPTAVNLATAVDRQWKAIKSTQKMNRESVALTTAEAIANEDAEHCKRIGEHGVGLIKNLSDAKPGKPVNILTHCNAGWLAFVDYGSALSPVYAAFDSGIPIHVYVDETRPRNQGAQLTAWELGQHGVPHTVIADNTGGHLMQHGFVDLVIVGADRVALNGDAANKIGTYLKALAAKDNEVPFYVAFPSSTIDWKLKHGKGIPIEERDGDEVKYVQGLIGREVCKVLVTPKDSPAVNYGFDVTPSRLITGLITERGVCSANRKGILGLFPEKRKR